MSEVIRHRRGDTREDGMVFWGYLTTKKERWMGREKFATTHAATKAYSKKYSASYYADNAARIGDTAKAYREANKEKVRETKAAYHRRNAATIKRKAAENYAANRKARVKAMVAYEKNRRATDPFFALSKNIRGRIKNALSSQGYTKKSKSFNIIGCSCEELRYYLELFFEEGMSWDNYGTEWHVDHIVPLACAKDEEELLDLNHFTNLQPLWAADNLAKGDKIPYHLAT